MERHHVPSELIKQLDKKCVSERSKPGGNVSQGIRKQSNASVATMNLSVIKSISIHEPRWELK